MTKLSHVVESNELSVQCNQLALNDESRSFLGNFNAYLGNLFYSSILPSACPTHLYLRLRAILFTFITWFFLVGVVALLPFFGHADDISHFKKFSVDHPLAYQSVRAITQDDDGFMWFGTHEGLHRFDGYQLKSFHHDGSNSNSLTADTISVLLIDRSGLLWVGTRGGGISLYAGFGESFLQFSTQSPQRKLINDNVNTLLETSVGDIWVGTEGGLNIIRKQETGYSVEFVQGPKLDGKPLLANRIEKVMESQRHEIWVATNGGGIAIFDTNGKFLRLLSQSDEEPDGLASNQVKALFQDHRGDIWIGGVEGGLQRFRQNQESLVRVDLNAEVDLTNTIIENIFEDTHGRLWIATDKGLLSYFPAAQRFQHTTSDANNPFSLSSDVVLTIFEDRDDTVWIGTFGGVNRWDPNINVFQSFNKQSHPQLSDTIITSFAQYGSKRILIGTYGGGLNILNEETGEITQPWFNHSLTELRIMTLLTQGDELWIGTRASGLYRIDLVSRQITRFHSDANDTSTLSADSVTDIFRDSKGNLWISTFQGGLNRYLGDGKFQRFLSRPEQPEKGPGNDQILQVVEDREGFLWLATYGAGIDRFDPVTAEFTHFKHDETTDHSISSDLAWLLYLDNQDSLWIGTQSAGLNLVTADSRVADKVDVKRFNIREGLKTRTIYGITQVKNNLWLATNKGISQFHQKSQTFTHFDRTHGLLDLEFNHRAIFRSQNGFIYFGSAKGFSRLNLSTELLKSHTPEIQLTNIYRLNEPMTFSRKLSELDQLDVEYRDPLIVFEYSGLDYRSPENTRYRYRLLGFDKEWVEAGTSRRATYTNLPAGNYELQLIAGNSNNQWSTLGYSLPVTVHPAPWFTWWAYLAYVFVIGLLFLLYARAVNRKLFWEQQQRQILKQQVQEKTQEFQLQNQELANANQLLEKAATTDRQTGAKSRRYLDIYIEQASRLMSQIHHTLAPVDKYRLPRLYIMMIRVKHHEKASASNVLSVNDLLQYSRNDDDLVVRWSEDTFAIIGYEKDDQARLLATKLSQQVESTLGESVQVNISYALFPFDIEHTMDWSWDQVSVITEYGLQLGEQESLAWLGVYKVIEHPLNSSQLLACGSLGALQKVAKIKYGVKESLG